uniref:Uncharacterized protein n=6 Tax=Triticinae TaxID=1648030 RepID=A0A453RGL6_AEGTS
GKRATKKKLHISPSLFFLFAYYDQRRGGETQPRNLPPPSPRKMPQQQPGASAHVLDSVPLFVVILGAAHVLALVFWIYKLASQKQPTRSKTH